MKEEIWKIPYTLVNENWDLLQRYLEFKGNPKYIIVGDVDLALREDISNLGNLVGIDGNLDLRYSSIESLGELEFVEGKLKLYGCENIKTLGKLKKVVRGYLNLGNSSIESLGELEFVGGHLALHICKKIKTLGNLKKVDGNLELNFSPIESLGNLQFVGGDLLIYNTKIHPSELNNVEIVGMIYR